MMGVNGTLRENDRPYDDVIASIVDYAYNYNIESSVAWRRAKLTLLDALGAALESIHRSQECSRMIRPYLPGDDMVTSGFKVPGTPYQTNILKGAFNLGSMIRYLDHNDAFPGAEWGHPSDNIGAILAAADVISRSVSGGSSLISSRSLTVGDVLTALIKSYEIQGCFQIRNAFNKVGLDHVILVKVASTALVSWLFGLSEEQAKAAVSHAWMDGHPLRVYRQAPNTGPRKGWAAGDACMRAVNLVLLVKAGQPGAPSALTTPKWGFYDVLFDGKHFELPRPFKTWVIESVIFKVNTAEGHGMTAVEAGLEVARKMKQRSLRPDDIAGIWVRTTEAGMTIIDKRGPLSNAADRDHCLRYMLAVVLYKGEMIQTEDYQDDSPWAENRGVERLRALTIMSEDKGFTRDYHDPDTRSISNSVQVQLMDGTWLDEVLVKYPQGHVLHPQTPQLVEVKAKANLALRFPMAKVESIINLVNGEAFDTMPVKDFVDMLAVAPEQ